MRVFPLWPICPPAFFPDGCFFEAGFTQGGFVLGGLDELLGFTPKRAVRSWFSAVSPRRQLGMCTSDNYICAFKAGRGEADGPTKFQAVGYFNKR